MKLNQITVTEKEGKFFAEFAFDWDTKDLVKKAGFRFDPKQKKWWTTSKEVADRVRSKEAIEAWLDSENQAIYASAALDADIDLPRPDGLEYLGYQKAGSAYAKDKPATLIADEMGLGKTIQAIGVANCMPEAVKILIICPASLRVNWKREWHKWDIHGRPATIITNKVDIANCSVGIVSYDFMIRNAEQIKGYVWGLMICDECHYLKNGQALRTRAILGYYDKKTQKEFPGISANKKLFLTGTPIVNRPIELWTIIRAVDPHDIGRSVIWYGKRYCDGQHNGYGWDFTGASNLEELHERLRKKFMVRRLKKDVLKELPAKRRTVIALEKKGKLKKLVEKEQKLAGIDPSTDFEAKVSELQAQLVSFTEMASVRRDIAVAKTYHVTDQVDELLEQTDKVVVFAHHHEVLDAIHEYYGESAVKLDGRMGQRQRQESVDRFQNDPEVKVFVGSIKAAGVGITLTSSSTVVFAELDWTPGGMSQAEDRVHRIGQSEMVNIFHVVIDESLDAHISQTIMAKQEVIDQALDNELPEEHDKTEVELVQVENKKSRVEFKKSKEEKVDYGIDDTQIEAVHQGLRMLAGCCDYALQKDDVGFNGVDTKFGHDLADRDKLTPKQALAARKMLKKYHRQLGPELMEAMDIELKQKK